MSDAILIRPATLSDYAGWRPLWDDYNRFVVGIAHYLFHRSTTRLNDVCYLQDLFTAEQLRGRGIGRRLIHAVYEIARAAGSGRVYWQTQATNEAGRMLYDKVANHQGFIVYAHELG
jgi:GNAT superfamily N-acetyltransferase